jgi:hypothetical protein
LDENTDDSKLWGDKLTMMVKAVKAEIIKVTTSDVC